MARLEGKRALVTGGTTGIGFATAQKFIAEGAKLIVTGNNPETIAQAQAAFGAAALVIKADSASVSEQRALADRIKAEFGALYIAFINAGISQWQPIEAFTEEQFDRQFAINVKGPFFLIQSLIPVFANPASVIMNASIFAHNGTPNSTVYSATKAGMSSFTKTMSAELIGRGVRFNAISCGPVDTPMFDKLGIPEAYREQAFETITASIPAGRFGNPDEVANAVTYLASDESAWTVGAEIIVDGGRLLNP
jgi:NAD(P)-dependent dehydrogenase (short-subunit alcohol dehydrogenase family)